MKRRALRSPENRALASRYVIDRNLCALAAWPLIFAAGNVKMTVPRRRLGFDVFYPAHLAVLCGLARFLLAISLRLA